MYNCYLKTTSPPPPDTHTHMPISHFVCSKSFSLSAGFLTLCAPKVSAYRLVFVKIIGDEFQHFTDQNGSNTTNDRPRGWSRLEADLVLIGAVDLSEDLLQGFDLIWEDISFWPTIGRLYTVCFSQPISVRILVLESTLTSCLIGIGHIL